jgi:hypothetical protein
MTVGEGSVRVGVRRSFAETVGVEGSGGWREGREEQWKPQRRRCSKASTVLTAGASGSQARLASLKRLNTYDAL